MEREGRGNNTQEMTLKWREEGRGRGGVEVGRVGGKGGGGEGGGKGRGEGGGSGKGEELKGRGG